MHYFKKNPYFRGSVSCQPLIPRMSKVCYLLVLFGTRCACLRHVTLQKKDDVVNEPGCGSSYWHFATVLKSASIGLLCTSLGRNLCLSNSIIWCVCGGWWVFFLNSATHILTHNTIFLVSLCDNRWYSPWLYLYQIQQTFTKYPRLWAPLVSFSPLRIPRGRQIDFISPWPTSSGRKEVWERNKLAWSYIGE